MSFVVARIAKRKAIEALPEGEEKQKALKSLEDDYSNAKRKAQEYEEKRAEDAQRMWERRHVNRIAAQQVLDRINNDCLNKSPTTPSTESATTLREETPHQQVEDENQVPSSVVESETEASPEKVTLQPGGDGIGYFVQVLQVSEETEDTALHFVPATKESLDAIRTLESIVDPSRAKSRDVWQSCWETIWRNSALTLRAGKHSDGLFTLGLGLRTSHTAILYSSF